MMHAVIRPDGTDTLYGEVYDQDAEPSVRFSPILTALAALVGAALLVLGALLVGVASSAWTLAGAAVSMATGVGVVLSQCVGGVYVERGTR